MQSALELLRELRAAEAHTPPVDRVRGRDLIAFRRGMYHAEMDGDGFFVFEGARRNAHQVHRDTQDKDALIRELILTHRAQGVRMSSPSPVPTSVRRNGGNIATIPVQQRKETTTWPHN